MAELERLLEKVTALRDEGNHLYIKKFNKAWVLSVIEESDEIKMIEQRFRDYDKRGVDIIDFVRVFLNIIDHTAKQTLFIVIALIDLFKDICECYGLTTHVKCSDIINYIVDVTYPLLANPLTCLLFLRSHLFMRLPRQIM